MKYDLLHISLVVTACMDMAMLVLYGSSSISW